MRVKPTQARCEQREVQVRYKLLLIGIEHALSSNYIPRQTDADDLHNCLEYQQY
jgi:hypothetical protein